MVPSLLLAAACLCRFLTWEAQRSGTAAPIKPLSVFMFPKVSVHRDSENSEKSRWVPYLGGSLPGVSVRVSCKQAKQGRGHGQLGESGGGQPECTDLRAKLRGAGEIPCHMHSCAPGAWARTPRATYFYADLVLTLFSLS